MMIENSLQLWCVSHWERRCVHGGLWILSVLWSPVSTSLLLLVGYLESKKLCLSFLRSPRVECGSGDCPSHSNVKSVLRGHLHPNKEDESDPIWRPKQLAWWQYLDTCANLDREWNQTLKEFIHPPNSLTRGNYPLVKWELFKRGRQERLNVCESVQNRAYHTWEVVRPKWMGRAENRISTWRNYLFYQQILLRKVSRMLFYNKARGRQQVPAVFPFISWPVKHQKLLVFNLF